MSAFKSACRPALFIFYVVQLGSCGDGGGTTSAITPKISVDQKIVAQEVECMKQYAAVSTNNYVNYAAAIGAPEHTDSIHSGVQPCATFTGSFSGSNQAAQSKSESTWSSIQFIVNDGPTGSYLLGGGLASDTAGQWNAFASIGVIADGTIIAVAGTTIVKRTTDYFSLVGPANQRVLISQYLNPDITSSTGALQTALNSGKYTETVEWANASTGATILRPASSAYTASTALGSLPNLGYGGLIYMMGNSGTVYFYKPEALTD